MKVTILCVILSISSICHADELIKSKIFHSDASSIASLLMESKIQENTTFKKISKISEWIESIETNTYTNSVNDRKYRVTKLVDRDYEGCPEYDTSENRARLRTFFSGTSL
ncbi:MAG: hypothetical protein HOE90_23900 [Bacteriovoracaceae bacterium]|jgi:hypothetical protein|nr:hypothetical protein [Bacteriovoracaceae bacterium]